MIAAWTWLVTIGAWGQAHQELLLACSATVVLLLGVVRWSWRAASPTRRPRL